MGRNQKSSNDNVLHQGVSGDIEISQHAVLRDEVALMITASKVSNLGVSQ